MKQIKSAVEFRFSNERGHELLQSGQVYAAAGHFLGAAGEQTDIEQRVRALQMSGVCFRLVKQHEKAIEYLTQAKELLPSVSDIRLQSAVHRDLGAALNTLGLKKKSRELLGEALKEFDTSMSILKSALSSAGLTQDERDQLTAERAATRGFLGLLLFEMNTRSGIDEIEEADNVLFKLGKPFEVYQLNNLVRRMRVSTFRNRCGLLQSALKLTSKDSQSPGSRKRVWVALLGNKVYRMFE